MKLKLTPVFLTVVIGLNAMFTACGSSDNVVQEISMEKVIYVNTEAVEIKPIKNEMSYPGQIKASEQVAVMSKISGMTDKVLVQTGDAVKEGDVLFTMEATDLENNIKSLEAQLAAAEVGIRSAETSVALANGSSMQSQMLQASSGVEQADTSLKTAEKNAEQSLLAVEQRELALTQAQLAYDDAEKNYNDGQALNTAGALSTAQLEQMETALSNARIALEQAKSALEQAKNSYNIALLTVTQSQTAYEQAVESQRIISEETPGENIRRAQDALEQAIAQRNSLRVNLETAKEKLSDIYIKSPISGTISSRNIEPKTMISAGAAPFTIVSADTVEARINVTEAIVNSLSVGQNVSVQVSAASDEPFIGKIITVSPTANEATSGFEIRISIDNKSGIIKPGMYAEAHFIREQAENSVVVRRDAVLTENNAYVVYVVEGDTAVAREVETGIDNGMEIEIISGITLGDAVVVKGQSYLWDGAKVKIEESSGETK